MTRIEKLLLQIRRAFDTRDWRAWGFYCDILDMTAQDEEAQ